MNDSLRKQIIAWIACNHPEEEFLLADGMEEGFMGIAYQFDKPFAIYDRSKCIKSLEDEGMSYEEAQEYFDFNVQGAYCGENTPAFMERFDIK